MRNISKYILRIALIAAAFVTGEGVMWGTSYFHAKMEVDANPSGKGTVYVGDTPGTTSQDSPDNTTEGQDYTFKLNAKPADGWHFVSWSAVSSPGKGTIVTPPANTASANVTVRTATSVNYDRFTGGGTFDDTHYYFDYKATATFEENYYANITANTTSGASGNPKVVCDSGAGVPSSSDKVQFTLTAEDAVSGYHFTLWTGTDITFSAAGSQKTTAFVLPSNTGGKGAAKEYTATANYAENYYVRVNTKVNNSYYGNAYVAYGSSFSGTATSADNTGTNGKTNTEDKETFSINAQSNTGYHFVNWTTSGGEIDNASSIETTISVAGEKDHIGKENPAPYTVTAHFDPNYYISVNAVSNNNEWGKVTATPGSGNNTESSGQPLIYDLTYEASEYYHFVRWEKTLGDSDGVISGNTFTGKTSNTPGEYNQYTVTGIFEHNLYYASLSAESGENGTIWVVTTSPRSSEASGGYVEFELLIEPKGGYHLDELTYTSVATGVFVTKEDGKTYAKVQLPEGENYGVEKALNYSIRATFAKDQFKAQLNTAISSISEETTESTAQVSSNGTDWGTSATITLGEAGTAKFRVKATAAEGFKFAGWSKESGSGTIMEGLGAEGEYEVPTSTTEGGTNTETIYAIFKRQYDIVINTILMDPGANGDRIIFDVTGPETYRVSVPVNGSLKIKDVEKGTYTVTPVSAWCWKYKDIASKEITCDAESVNEVTFNPTKKITSKKSAENHNTISY